MPNAPTIPPRRRRRWRWRWSNVRRRWSGDPSTFSTALRDDRGRQDRCGAGLRDGRTESASGRECLIEVRREECEVGEVDVAVVVEVAVDPDGAAVFVEVGGEE